VTISREDFRYFVRPSGAEPALRKIHAVERVPNGSALSRYTLCGVEWESDWEEFRTGPVPSKNLCGTCDKAIRRRIREAETARTLATLSARVGEEATATVEGLLAEVNRTIGGVEVARGGLDYCLDTLEGIRKELIALMGGRPTEEGVSPPSE
jgi:hypothetical protein